MVNLIGVKVIEYLKAIGTFIAVIAIFYCGKLKAEKKRLEGDLEDRESENKNLHENIEIIKTISDTSFSDADELFKERKNRNKK